MEDNQKMIRYEDDTIFLKLSTNRLDLFIKHEIPKEYTNESEMWL